MLGSMGYTDERTKIMLLTDPIYYFGTFLLQKKEASYSTFEDISGHTIGTVTGFTLVPELKSIPDVKEVKLYDTSDGVMRDLVAGRLDMAVLDPGLVEYALLQHPEWGLHQVPLKPQADKYPIMSTKYYAIMGIWPEDKELHEAVNAEIQKAWATCLNVKTMAKYGLGSPGWFEPPEKNYRIDRPADWKAPTADKSCFAAQ
jgi:polar amino acid transport system substrate-binding protein